MARRESSSSSPRHSLPSAAAAPMRRTAAVVVLLLQMLLLQALVGPTDACSVTVTNSYEAVLGLEVYNGWDLSCDAYFALYTIGSGNYSTGLIQSITVNCVGLSGCKIGLGSGDDHPGCGGTALVACGDTLEYYETEGRLKYCDHARCNPNDDNGGYDDGSGRMLQLPEDEEEDEDEEEGFFAAVPGVGSSSGGGNLRGAKGSNAIFQK